MADLSIRLLSGGLIDVKRNQMGADSSTSVSFARRMASRITRCIRRFRQASEASRCSIESAGEQRVW